MPNAKRLAEMGGFSPLKTSVPPQSPVAWANVITGMNPGGHGIFDFIHREPESLLPFLSTSKTEAPAHTLSLGNWNIPLSPGRVALLRKGKSFWNILEEHGIDCTVFRIPSNFPPESSKARTISGMGTPDLLGSYGEFTLFSAIAPPEGRIGSGGSIQQLRAIKNRAEVELVGPANFLKKPDADRNVPKLTVKVEIVRDPDHDLVNVAGGEVVDLP